MASDSSQRAAHKFFIEHLQTLKPFTRADLKRVTHWSDRAIDTYWSKQFKNILEPTSGDQWRVRERFRLYLEWRKFKGLVTQVKSPPPSYAPTVYDEVVVYEFYLPLAHEGALRLTLDSLFYKDIVLPRLQRIGVDKLRAYFDRKLTDSDDGFFDKVCEFVNSKFGGYSIYHVSGRFRTGELLSQEDAYKGTKAGQLYLVDETTAIVRFIFPCLRGEAERVRFLFQHLFMDPITEQVSGEDQIWVIESGDRNNVQVWKPKP